MKIKLKNISTNSPSDWDNQDSQDSIKDAQKELSDWVLKFQANKSKALLIVLQGIDASGKDGTTQAITESLSPSWVHVASFKKPTEIELSHDYLWRIHQEIPAKGEIGVFNRSHYEDIIIPSVYGTLSDKQIDKRYQQIADFEAYLQENDVVIIKLFLHISKDRQKEKLMERIENPKKQYKHSDDDWKTRERWDDFQNVYERMLNKADKPEWNIIPCDSSKYRNYLAINLVIDKLKELALDFPPFSSELFQNTKVE